jgi:signal transduction histidine kinase
MPHVWGDVASALLVACVVFGFVHYFTSQASRTERQLGRARAEAAVLAERQRIAREMHDGVAQALFLVRVRLDDLERDLARGDAVEARARVTGLRTQVRVADQQVRAAIADLKSESGAEDPTEALGRDATRVATSLGLDLSLALDDLPPLDARGRQHLIAIVSEAISNAARHGGATRITIAAARDRLVVSDNGRGFDLPRPGTGWGLTIMSERAALIGGRLEVRSAEGHGATLTVSWGNGREEARAS